MAEMKPNRKTGAELFTGNGLMTPVKVADFWAWSMSDLLSNIVRGVLAEFIVAMALGIPTEAPRDPWEAYDLRLLHKGRTLKIEVKSAAYLQSWAQKAMSKITFGTKASIGFDENARLLSEPAKRWSDVYVFSLLNHQNRDTVNPLDLDQWTFFAVPTEVLNRRESNQRAISLAALRKAISPTSFKPAEATFTTLEAEVRGAADWSAAEAP